MLLACPLCRTEIDPGGPGVSTSRDGTSYWTPFIEDLRGTPDRLVHARCLADEAGLDALVSVVHAHDAVVRQEMYRRWQADQARNNRALPPQIERFLDSRWSTAAFFAVMCVVATRILLDEARAGRTDQVWWVSVGLAAALGVVVWNVVRAVRSR